MIRAIVIDDEKPSREVICNYLRDFCNDVEVIATAPSIKTGYKVIRRENPDLVFLDIELGGGTSFDLLKMFNRINFKIIFITAYSEHAIRAFRVNAIDYLLKPIKIDELKSAIEKVKVSNIGSNFTDQILTLIKSISITSAAEATLVIPHLKGFDVLKVNEIIMCKADGYCTEFHLTGKRKIVSSKNLKNYASFLSNHNFLRVHHSYMVSLSHIINVNYQGEIKLTSDCIAYLGDSYKKILMQTLSNYIA